MFRKGNPSVSIPDAFSAIATAFSAAGLGPYKPAQAIWQGETVYDDGGSIITPGQPVSVDCMVQKDVATEAMRAEAGFQQTDVSLYVLASGVVRPIDTDATIAREGETFSVQSAVLDAMESHWICRGRLTNG